MEKEPISFGALESPLDPRTFTQDSFARAAETSLPRIGKVALDYPSVKELCDQRKLGVCTMCGVRMASESHFKDGVRLDEYWGYLIGKTLIDDVQFGSHFEGSSALTMLKAANKYGIPERDFCEAYPLKTDGTYEEFISDFQKKHGGRIPQPILNNAARHKIPGYFRIDGNGKPSRLSVAAEVARGRVVVGRFAVGKNLYRDRNGKSTRKAKDLLPLRAPQPAESGHIMDISQYWEWGEEMGGPNSWSRTWCPDNAKQEAGYYWFQAAVQYEFFTEAWAIKESSDRYVFSKDLTLGSTGPDVVALQKHLVALGMLTMPPGVAYGSFGERTRAAVAMYQATHGITPIAGYFGPKTRAHVNVNQ